MVRPAPTHSGGARSAAPAEAATRPSGGAPETEQPLHFPRRFAWGAATSAYQIEGAAAVDGRGESVWDRFCDTAGKVRGGDSGDVAADHYRRYAEDLDLMRDIGLQTYRFSISWPRVLPDGAGRPNERGLDFYRRLLDGLLERDITPMVTLFHWDLPQALQDQGGWVNRDAAFRFADYARLVFEKLGDRVLTWLTINEPKTIVQNGYLEGSHAPGLRDPEQAYVAAHHLLLAHGLAVQALRDSGSGARIGPALNLHPCYPVDDSPEARDAAWLQDGFENRLYLDPVMHGRYPRDVLEANGRDNAMVRSIRDGDLSVIASPVDLLAIQYYTPLFIAPDGARVRRWPTSEAAWQEIYPDGLYDVLTRVARDYDAIPLTITENGLPTADRLGPSDTVDDAERVSFLRSHLAAAHRAISDGVLLESYHVWSLLDNFEWAEGYSQRWGLIYVDYDSQKRVLKRSALWYRDVISSNTVR